MTAAHHGDMPAEPGHRGPGAPDPVSKGQWEPVSHRFSHLPVHLALLPTGKVLGFGGSGNDETREGRPYPAELWDPATGDLRVIDPPLEGDVFCGGHAFLPDGRLLVAGGTYRYNHRVIGPLRVPFSGLDQAYVFDPWTETWSRTADTGRGRWYPTLVGLPDGSVLAAGGFTKHLPWAFRRDVEVYSPEDGWRRLPRASRWLPLYPRLHLVPGGVFYAGSYNTHYTFPFRLKGFPTALFDLRTLRWNRLGAPRVSERQEGGSILLPLRPPEHRAKVLLVGGGKRGGKEATAAAEIIDLAEAQPAWRTLAHGMAHPRYWLYPVILPDGRALVIGGRGGHAGHDMPPMPDMEAHGEPGGDPPTDPRAVHEPEVFDPESETWQPMAPMSVDRLYHSGALLLPDGRVMTAGSNPDRRVNELRIEVYRPPYLFGGERPEIATAPSVVRHGESFEIEAPEADGLEIALVRPSATTHCLATEVRWVGLTVRPLASDALRVEVPADRGVLPPGWYMLFALRAGRPSKGTFIRVE
jgi:Galactose oxidase-like, Early set domain